VTGLQNRRTESKIELCLKGLKVWPSDLNNYVQ
jgi:hypothetical protein